MKGTFKKKRWLAFLLALVLVISTEIASSDAFLWATSETVETSVNGTNPEGTGSDVITGSQKITAEDTGGGGTPEDPSADNPDEEDNPDKDNPDEEDNPDKDNQDGDNEDTVTDEDTPEDEDPEAADETEEEVQDAELPEEVMSFVEEMKKLPEADKITEDNAEEVYALLYSEKLSDGFALAQDYLEDDEVKAACEKYEDVFRAAEEILGLLSSLYDEIGYLTDGWDFDSMASWIKDRAGENITLQPGGNTNNYTFTGTLTIPANTTVTVKNIAIWRGEGSGYNGPLFKVEAGATLILESMSLHGTESKEKCEERINSRGLWASGSLVEVCGTLNLNSGAYLHGNGNNGKGGGVYVRSGGTLNFESGASIVGCDAQYGGGVFLETGATYNKGGSIENCKATVIGDEVCWESDLDGDSRLLGKKVFLTILTGQNEIPTEPAVISGEVFLETDENYNVTKLGWGEGEIGFSENAAKYISADIFKNPNFKTVGSAQGLGNSTEADLKNKYLIGNINWDLFLENAVRYNKETIYAADGTEVTTSNVGNYELYPYVIKYQSGDSEGWHIDCIAKAKNQVTLTYELNLQDKIDNLNGFSTSNISGHAYSSGKVVTVGSATYEGKEITAGSAIQVTKDGESATLYFMGWSTSSSGKVEYEPGDTFQITSNTTLYGVWKTELNTHEISYTVEYYKDGEKVEGDTETVSENVVLSEDKLKVEAIDEYKYKSEYYEFDRYEIDDEIKRELPEQVVDKTVIKVYYKSMTETKWYTVEYYKDGEKVEEDTRVIEMEVPVDTETLTVEEGKVDVSPTKYEGYELAYINGEGNKVLPIEVDAGDVIRVYYTVIKYKITYDLDGGKLADNVSNPGEYTVNDIIEIKNEPTREHYTFLGWVLKNENDNTYPEDEKVETNVKFGRGATGDRTYKAVWQEETKYALTVRMVDRDNQNKEISKGIESEKYYVGTEYTFSGIEDEGDITLKINNETENVPKAIEVTNSDGTETWYVYDSGAVNGTISSGKEDNVVTLFYAIDENHDGIADYRQHNVTYNLNGGHAKGENENGCIIAGPYTEGEPVLVIETVPTKTGEYDNQRYTFAGWAGENGEIVTSGFTMPDKNVTLTAQWNGLSISKEEKSDTPVNGYGLGNTVTYKITVRNIGDTDLKNVIVTDEKDGVKLTIDNSEGSDEEGTSAAAEDGDEEDGETEESGDGESFKNTVTIPELKAEATVTITAEYVVDETDIAAAKRDQEKLENTATATVGGLSVSATKEVSIVGVEKQLKVEKSIRMATDADGKEYPDGANGIDENGKKVFKAGDTVTFDVTVTNTGNQTLKNIEVKDEMLGASVEEEVSSVESLANTFIARAISSPYTIARNEEGKIEIGRAEGSSNFAIIASLAPGEKKIYTVTYEIKESDIERTFYNIVTATAGDEGTPEDEKTTASGKSDDVPVEQPVRSAEIKKSIGGITKWADGKYKPGDEITYTITVKNTGNVTLNNFVVKDTMTAVDENNEPVELSGSISIETVKIQIDGRDVVVADGMVSINSATGVSEFTIGSIGVGKTATITYTYKVDSDDAGKTIGNAAVGSDDDGTETEEAKPDGDKPVIEKRSLSVEKVLLDKEGAGISKDDLEDKKYGTGTIRFKVTVTNTGNVELKDVTVEDVMSAKTTDGTSVSEDRTAELVKVINAQGEEEELSETFNLSAGETKVLEYEYRITENDLGCQLFNTATASAGNDEDAPEGSDEVGPITVEDPETKASISKTITSNVNPETGMYKYGDETYGTIEYQIVVKNKGNTTLKKVEVKDTMTGASGTISNVKVGNDEISESGSADEGAASWKRGEEGENIFTIPEIPVDGTVTITYNYVIQEADVGKTIGNTAEIDDENIETVPEDPENPDPVNPDPITVENRKLSVTKEVVDPPADDEAYQLGEEIIFAVTVENVGNVDLTGITLEDTMVGTDTEAAAVTVSKDENGKIVTTPIDGGHDSFDLPVGESEIFYYSYAVQEEDLRSEDETEESAGIKNTVKATASDEDKTKGEGETEYLKIDDQKPDYTVAKEIKGAETAEDGKYKVGDKIQYQITVKNTGNTKLTDVTVKDIMTGASGEISDVTAVKSGNSEPADSEKVEIGDPTKNVQGEMAEYTFTIPEMAVGETVVITYAYEIQSGDAGKNIKNAAWKGSDTEPDPDDEDSNTEIVVENRKLSVRKEVAYPPANGEAFVMGEDILFKVTVANTGNVSLSDIEVSDEMQNAAGQATAVEVTETEDGGKTVTPKEGSHIIESLEPGKEAVVYYSYTVQREDIGRTDIQNRVTAESAGDEDTTDDDTTDEDVIKVDQIDGLHTLTVRYVYTETGAEAALTAAGQFAAGEDYLVYSPVIDGYNSSAGFVTGTMPGGNLELVVYYTRIPDSSTAPQGGGNNDGGGNDNGGGNDDGGENNDPGTLPVPLAEPDPVVVIPGENGIIPVIVPTPTEPELAQIGDEDVPLQGALIDVDDDGNVTITAINEDEVPLAGGMTDDDRCCVLHFLLMLAALIIYTWHIYDMKKRQKRLAKLADELAEEKLKKQPGNAKRAE